MSYNIIKTDTTIYEVKEFFENEMDKCNEICQDLYHYKISCTPRSHIVSIMDKNIIYIKVIVLISNISSEPHQIESNDFTLIDSDDLSHEGMSFCDKYSLFSNSYSGMRTIPPQSKIKYEIIFPTVEKGKHAIKLLIEEKKKYYNIILKDIVIGGKSERMNSIIIENLYRKLSSLQEENNNLKNKIKDLENKTAISSTNKTTYEDTYRSINSNPVKYTIKEDDDYLYILSGEKESTISFNREFDKSKDNYNWININEALITMRLDNIPYYMSPQTKIESPVSGIFEYDKNKLIAHEEAICRIKKYDQSEKEKVLLELEMDSIKEAVYKKERKKKIERDALDELILKGLVFNSYTTKEGNRATIPTEVANAVWNRDGGKCVHCGKKEKLEFDHIIPISKGGSNTYRNLQLLCEICNREKSDKIV
jgi:hypothetical protein